MDSKEFFDFRSFEFVFGELHPGLMSSPFVGLFYVGRGF